MNSESSCRYDRLARSAGGLGSSHQWLLDRVPHGASVLDCGCAGGFLAEAAVRLRDAVVDGLEIDPRAAASAAHVCRDVRVGSLDDAEFLASLTRSYDRILFGDVLEHLAEPERALARAAELLAPDGRILIAIPNIAYWRVRLDLLRGQFQYQDSGILDRTHLRFYTYRSVRQLARDANCEVVDQDMTIRVSLPGIAGGALRTVMRMVPNLFAYQTLLELKPCHE